jgi:molybdenum cofactor cytidylyltransferase
MKLNTALRINPGEVVAFVGGGGKTSAMFRLADELAQQKRRVLTTTSTRIFGAQVKRSPAHVIFTPGQTIQDLLPALEVALAQHSQVLLVGQTEIETGKAFGIPPELIDSLAATRRFEVILNEADGSRMRPFKAPAGHEPVIPASTSLVVPVVGLDILGQPLQPDTTHRAELVSELSGTPLDKTITTRTVAAVLAHPQGGLKNAPAGARIIPLLNKAETPNRLAAAQEIAARLLDCERVDSVAIGAIQSGQEPVVEVWGRTAAVVLAAGGSSRFGSPKQLAQWEGKSFIEQVVDTALASPARPVIVVLGAEVAQSQKLLAGRPVEVVLNPAWAEGQSTSMKAGLAALPPTAYSAVFLLVDLPGVTPEIISTLIQRHRQTLAPLVWPEYEGQRGNPVLFDRALFPELGQVSGDSGGRPVVMKYKDQAEKVIVAQRGILEDFDRPEDLENFRAGGSGNI